MAPMSQRKPRKGRPPVEGRARDQVLRLRIGAAEAAAIRAEAARLGMTTSDLIRRSLRGTLADGLPVEVSDE